MNCIIVIEISTDYVLDITSKYLDTKLSKTFGFNNHISDDLAYLFLNTQAKKYNIINSPKTDFMTILNAGEIRNCAQNEINTMHAA